MREDICVNCGHRIFLLKEGPTKFRWVTDPEDATTDRCVEEPPPKVEQGILPRRHAPISMRESHR